MKLINYVLMAIFTILASLSVIGVLMMNNSLFLREAYCIFWASFVLFGYVGIALIINSTRKE